MQELDMHITSPAAATESTLKTIWGEVLELDDIDSGDDFFDLGGDSLQAVEVVLRARELGIPLEVGDLFAAGTLAGVVAGVTASATSGTR